MNRVWKPELISRCKFMSTYGKLHATCALGPKARRAGIMVAVGGNPRNRITHVPQFGGTA
jgi:hypothetical protein